MIKLWGKKLLQGVKAKEKEEVTFFTIYNIVPSIKDKVILNDYRFIKSNVKSLDVTDNIYFVGSPISESSIVSEQSYLDHLARVKKHYSGRKVLYIVHRRESKKKLERIKKELEMEFVLFDYPLEYQLAFIGPRPELMASFISSALDSCRLIFGDCMSFASFKLDLSQSPVRNEIEEIYKSYESDVGKNFLLFKEY